MTSIVTITKLDKIAGDNGFDLRHEPLGGWLPYASTRAPLRIWLTVTVDTPARWVAAFSQAHVATALAEHGTSLTWAATGLAIAPPAGATAYREVADYDAMHAMIARAYILSRTLPNELLLQFEAQTEALPKATEVERLVVQRVGQEMYRMALLAYWKGRCAVTGLAVPELLRASHIKPWASCATDAERLDVYNGLLLAPHLDAAFDRGFITFANDGTLLVSATLDADAQRLLGFAPTMRLDALTDHHRKYMAWHRDHVFKGVPNG